MLLEPAGDQVFAAVQRHGRLELPVRQLRHPFQRSGNPGVPFDVVVPGCDIGVPNRPIGPEALAGVRLEVEVAPAIALPPPHQRAPTYVVAAIPVESLHLGVGRLLVRSPPIQIRLVQRVVALQDRVCRLHRLRAPAAMGIIPWRFGRIHVVLDVLDILAPLEQQNPQSFLRELFRRPTAGDTRPDHDGIVAL